MAALALWFVGLQTLESQRFRYLMNQLRNGISWDRSLECDLKQTEFTPPTALLNITEPVLGPPSAHQRTPWAMVYFGKWASKNN